MDSMILYFVAASLIMGCILIVISKTKKQSSWLPALFCLLSAVLQLCSTFLSIPFSSRSATFCMVISIFIAPLMGKNRRLATVIASLSFAFYVLDVFVSHSLFFAIYSFGFMLAALLVAVSQKQKKPMCVLFFVMAAHMFLTSLVAFDFVLGVELFSIDDLVVGLQVVQIVFALCAVAVFLIEVRAKPIQAQAAQQVPAFTTAEAKTENTPPTEPLKQTQQGVAPAENTVPKTKRCPNCNNIENADTYFCSKCGAKL